MIIYPREGYAFNIREGTTDEQAVLECCKKQVYRKKGKLEIEAGDIWLDLGANIGGFSIHAMKQGASRVYALEPEKENYEILEGNIAHNGLGGFIKAMRAAVVAGDQKRMRLYICNGEKNKYRHTLVPIKRRESVTVDCIKFDTLIKEGITAVKMDIEGAEMEILDATENWHGVKKLAMEYHFDMDRSVANFRRRMKKLEAHFPHVEYARVPDDLVEYNFYPAMRIVHCYF